ncbi:MAG: hypothetical protein EOO02_04955, partial [Chitinophagaceae bacterium]
MKKDDPYNESLGDKMERLPLPDVQHNWQEMRRLLDQDMPRGGGYSKRRGGWWLFGSVLLLVITGSWLLTTMNPRTQNADPPVSKGVNISPPQSDEIAGTEKVPNQSEKPNEKNEEILHREKEQIINPENENPGSSDAGSDLALHKQKNEPLTSSEIQRSELLKRAETSTPSADKEELTPAITKSGRVRKSNSNFSVIQEKDEDKLTRKNEVLSDGPLVQETTETESATGVVFLKKNWFRYAAWELEQKECEVLETF